MSKEKLQEIKYKYTRGGDLPTLYESPLDSIHVNDLMRLAYNQALQDINSSLSEVQGREGCTYGDTDFDSLSAAHGYNEAIEHTKQSILKLKI